MSSNIRAVIDGPSESGKTTVAIWQARLQWQRHHRRSIVFDPWKREHTWGPWAIVFDDIETFKKAVWKTKGFAIFWDESTDSLNRHAREDRAFFTAIRHNHPALFVMVHDYAVLSPVMRSSITEAFLFRQSSNRAKQWAEQFADDDILKASELAQYEFIHKRAFKPIERRKPTVEELAGPNTEV
jgi:hypothetical protein